MCVCMCVCMHVCAFMQVCTYICMHYLSIHWLRCLPNNMHTHTYISYHIYTYHSIYIHIIAYTWVKRTHHRDPVAVFCFASTSHMRDRYTNIRIQYTSRLTHHRSPVAMFHKHTTHAWHIHKHTYTIYFTTHAPSRSCSHVLQAHHTCARYIHQCIYTIYIKDHAPSRSCSHVSQAHRTCARYIFHVEA